MRSYYWRRFGAEGILSSRARTASRHEIAKRKRIKGSKCSKCSKLRGHDLFSLVPIAFVTHHFRVSNLVFENG
jgi:hypothetical protein